MSSVRATGRTVNNGRIACGNRGCRCGVCRRDIESIAAADEVHRTSPVSVSRAAAHKALLHLYARCVGSEDTKRAHAAEIRLGPETPRPKAVGSNSAGRGDG